MSKLTHFRELTILSDPEISAYFIWQKLFKQVHVALADIKNKHGIDTIGVSFPDYYYDAKNQQSSKLGRKLRVFAHSEQDLQMLNLDEWLAQLTDYVHIKSVKPVPSTTKNPLLVRRFRYKSMHRLAKDYAAYKDINYDQAMAYCLQHKAVKDEGFPYINLTSEETSKPFKLSLIQESVDEPHAGTFNTYGINNISGKVTVPNF